MNILAAALDIILSLKAWRSLKFIQILRYLLKFVVAAVWAVVLPIGYSSSVQNPSGLVKFFSDWSNNWQSQSFYNYAIAIYLLPNVLAAIVFFVPSLRRTMERSNWRIITLIMWWAQASTYTGCLLHSLCVCFFIYLFFIYLFVCLDILCYLPLQFSPI